MADRTRRSFIRDVASGSAFVLGAASGTGNLSDHTAPHPLTRRRNRQNYGPNEQIQIAIIGAGGMGVVDVNTALEIDGVKLVAASDLYDGRLEAATSNEDWNQGDLFTTKDYREVLARDDVDAVIVATPDHWHRQITIDALEAGKPVYCEKPMIHHVEQGMDVVEAERRTGTILQVGSQGMSSLGNEKAKELYEAGAIGELNYVEGFWARNSPGGAWQYGLPDDASEETVDWDTFLGDTERLPFDPVRFFRWRNYNTYGTGVTGDLFVHLFSSLHFILSSNGPDRIMATGGLRYWKDGRDAPDVVLGMFDYPESDGHPPFNLSLRVNFVDGTSGNTVLRLVGNEGSMDVGWTEVSLHKNKVSDPMAVFQDEMDPRTERYGQRRGMLPPADAVYRAEENYWGAHVDHFVNFFEGIRTGVPTAENSTFGFRAAAPAVLCNKSLFEERIIRWNPETMRLVD